MADLGFGSSGFDAEAPENQSERSLIPAGDYKAIMVESEKKQTKDGSGHYLNTKWQIVSGECQNRIVFQKFNLWSSSEQASAISRGQFSECCRAVGVLSPKDSSELHNKPCVISVVIKEDKKGQYDDQNQIKKYKPASVSGAVTSQAPQSNNSQPW